MEARGDGIVGVITNRWWFENVTFRGMRQSLLNTFDQVHIFDLQGEAGQKDDKNVFDITKGVAIALFVKNPTAEKRVRYSSVRGTRLAKYEACANAKLSDAGWGALTPTSPNYFLVPRTEKGREFYESLWSVHKLFVEGSTGVLTGRDRLAVAQTKDALKGQLRLLMGTATDRDIEIRFGLEKVEHWSMDDARKALREHGLEDNLIRRIAYRPFDTRLYYDHDALVFRRRDKIMRQMKNDNVGLAVCRLTRGDNWCHCLIASEPTDDSYISDKSKERAYLLPLWRTQFASTDDREDSSTSTIENLSSEFREFLDSRYEHHYTPEELLGYIYAVLHTPTYRARYAEFLRIDFPRVPFPRICRRFRGAFGARLGAHSGAPAAPVAATRAGRLSRQGRPFPRDRALFAGRASNYHQQDQSFNLVPPGVWDFQIGGYQVLDKYLKSRRGRVLSLDEINHVGAVADSLAFTIDQMARVDQAYRSAFPEQV
jgi:predicted helicase